MATVLITVTDGDLPGEVIVDLDLGEDVGMDVAGTPAQHAAIEMIRLMGKSQNVSQFEQLVVE